ncbi:MAG: hypothetical protein ACLFN8_02435 [Candidatus Woesearchaeota archaeon]
MSYLEQLQKNGTMSAVERQTSQFSNAQRAQTRTIHDPIHDFKEQIDKLQTSMFDQRNKFERFLTINQNRMMTLEKEVNELRSELTRKTEMLNKLSDKETVQRSREALFTRQDRVPLDRPVDRNNVAPSQVQIENIFNCSGKKF